MSSATAAPSGADILQQVTTDLNNIISSGKAVIQRVETDALQDVEAGYLWLKGELTKLEPTILADLKADVQKALQDALAGGSTAGSIVADVLDLLSNQGSGVLQSVESSVLTAFIAFVTTTVAAV